MIRHVGMVAAIFLALLIEAGKAQAPQDTREAHCAALAASMGR